MATKARSFASQRTSALSISAIKEMAMRAARIDDVASLTWGVPSFRTPQHIRDAVEAALKEDADIGKYTLPDGLPSLREAIADAHGAMTGLEISADRNVVVTAGNMQGVKAMLDTILDPGDEVIVTDPGFASHFQQIRLSGGVPVYWPLDEANGWSTDVAALPTLITPRTRAILLVTPSNPTGRIFAHTELVQVGEIARRAGLLVILDDPYSKFQFSGGDQFPCIAADARYFENIAYLFTFSKCHAMSGWRLGYAIVPEELKRQFLKVHDAMLICAPRPSQMAGLAAMQGPDDHLHEFSTILKRRRALICERLDRVPHVFSYYAPQGAYYVFPKIETAHQSSHQFALELLDTAKVCVTPGAAFGPSGESHVRMAFCVDDDEINRAFDRVEQQFPR